MPTTPALQPSFQNIMNSWMSLLVPTKKQSYLRHPVSTSCPTDIYWLCPPLVRTSSCYTLQERQEWCKALNCLQHSSTVVRPEKIQEHQTHSNLHLLQTSIFAHQAKVEQVWPRWEQQFMDSFDCDYDRLWVLFVWLPLLNLSYTLLIYLILCLK